MNQTNPACLIQELLDTHTEHKTLTWEIQWVLDHPKGYEGPWHQLAVCRCIVTRFFQNKLVKQDVIYIPRPEKTYKFLGVSHGAGWCQGERKTVYWCPQSGQLFHREPDDYKGRMANAKTR